MCGIFGSLGGPALPDGEAERLADTLRHRGPDAGGVWRDPDAGILLAHRRLSILELSPLGDQPMASASGRFVATYNGEIYNFPDLRRELEGLGHAFRGRSDTEVMLAAFDQWGVRATLPRQNGMFAAGVWDRRDRALHLFRDRAGEKPLYYGWCGSTFLFASELKALRAHPAFRAPVDRGSLALYLAHDYIPSPRTIYGGIRKLPPGTWLLVGREPEAYWSAADEARRGRAERFSDSEPELVARLESLLRDAVRIRMLADVPVGAFLSGGIDSSLVVALMQASSARPVRTFTIGFREAGYDEAKDALQVARHLGTDHTELTVTPQEARDVIPLLPDLYDEPFADSSQIPTHLIAKLARPEVTVALSGDAGDELFGGYARYQLGRRIWRSVERVPRPARRAAGWLLRAVPPRGWDLASRAVAPHLRIRRRWGEHLHKLGAVLSNAGPEPLFVGLNVRWRLAETPALGVPGGLPPLVPPFASSGLGDVLEWMMLADFVTYLPDDILAKVDRAAMGVGLETRIPYLDPRVVEFAFRLPLSCRIRGSEGKWILRQVLGRHVPRPLFERPKMGFSIPLGAWLRGPLRPWAEELLSPRRLESEGYLRPAPIRRRWEDHLQGRADWSAPLWSVLVFQSWLRRGSPDAH